MQRPPGRLPGPRNICDVRARTLPKPAERTPWEGGRTTAAPSADAVPSALQPGVRAVAMMFAPSREAVPHDRRRADASTGEAVYGRSSGRGAAASLLDGPTDGPVLKALLLPAGGDGVRMCEMRGRAGRRQESLIAICRDRRSVMVAALCVNDAPGASAGGLAVRWVATEPAAFGSQDLRPAGGRARPALGPSRRVSAVSPPCLR